MPAKKIKTATWTIGKTCKECEGLSSLSVKIDDDFVRVLKAMVAEADKVLGILVPEIKKQSLQPFNDLIVREGLRGVKQYPKEWIQCDECEKWKVVENADMLTGQTNTFVCIRHPDIRYSVYGCKMPFVHEMKKRGIDPNTTPGIEIDDSDSPTKSLRPQWEVEMKQRYEDLTENGKCKELCRVLRARKRESVLDAIQWAWMDHEKDFDISMVNKVPTEYRDVFKQNANLVQVDLKQLNLNDLLELRPRKANTLISSHETNVFKSKDNAWGSFHVVEFLDIYFWFSRVLRGMQEFIVPSDKSVTQMFGVHALLIGLIRLMRKLRTFGTDIIARKRVICLCAPHVLTYKDGEGKDYELMGPVEGNFIKAVQKWRDSKLKT